MLASLRLDWEWIIVDDHSADETFAVIEQIASRDSRIRGIRFARNFGSHAAVACGMHHARGDCAVVIAADLQDPPETICDLLVKWEGGAQLMWAV
jgi:dolichol-phosphate mannosyltransferase